MRIKPVLPLKVVVPLLLGIVVSLAIAVYSELGNRRLLLANRQIALLLETESALR